MPAISQGISTELAPGFKRIRNAHNQHRIYCTPCQEEMEPSKYNRHRTFERHLQRANPPAIPLPLPSISPQFNPPAAVHRSPSPSDSRDTSPHLNEDEDMSGYEAPPVNDFEERENFSPAVPQLHRTPIERVLRQNQEPVFPLFDDEAARIATLEKELGIVEGGESVGDTDELAALIDELTASSCDTVDFTPFANATEFGLYALSNVPVNPPSRNFMKLLCSIFKLSKTPDPPTYYRLLKVTKDMQELSNEPPLELRNGSSGTPYCHKSLRAAFERDLANPRLAKLLDPYPRRYSGLKDLKDGRTMNYEVDPTVATQMINYANRDLYVFEPVKLKDDTFFTPTRWFTMNENWGCEGLRCTKDGDMLIQEEEGESGELKEIGVEEFNFSRSAQNEIEKLRFVNASKQSIPKINPQRELAQNRPSFSYPIVIHMDDFSGASKDENNTHWAIQFTNGALPRRNRQELSQIRLFSASKAAEPLDLLEGLCAELAECFLEPTEMFHVGLQQKVLVRLYPLVELGDTAMSDKACSHMGSAANKNCRICKAGGNQAERVTAIGFEKYLTIGELRNAPSTIETIRRQLNHAERDDTDAMLKLATKTGIKDKIASSIATELLQLNDQLSGKAKLGKKKRKKSDEERQNDVEELRLQLEALGWHNPLLDLAQGPLKFDIHQRTPQDVLHVYVLGPLSFLVEYTNSTLSPEAKDQLQVRLENVVTTGFGSATTLPAESLIKHMGTLVGRERVWLAQSVALAMAPLVKDGFVDEELQVAWRWMGELGRMFHVEEIAEDDIDSYLIDLNETLRHVIDSFSRLNADKITKAFKFHGCLHLERDTLRFGPPISTSCSRHEAKNGRLKMDSIHSNRGAPSKDIGTKEARIEFFIHLLEGGHYKRKDGSFGPVGRGISKFVADCRILRQLYGLGDPIKPYTDSPQVSKPIDSSQFKFNEFAFKKFKVPSPTLKPQYFSRLTNKVDVFEIDNFALVSLDPKSSDEYGFEDREEIEQYEKVVKIRCFAKFRSTDALAPPNLSESFAIVQKMTDRGVITKEYGMKSYQLEKEIGIFPVSSLICTLSLAHDCVFGKCKVDSDGGRILVERIDQGFTKPAVICTDTKRYVLNSTLFRSSHLVGKLCSSPPPAPTIKEIAERLYPTEEEEPEAEKPTRRIRGRSGKG